MKTTIVSTAFNRPEYLKESLESWEEVRGLEDVEFHIFIDPSNRLDEVQAVCSESPIGLTVHVNPSGYGVLHNPWVAFEHAFNAGADFVIQTEDDDLVSTDVLEYFNWTSKVVQRDSSLLGVCAFTMEDGDPYGVKAGEGFGPWVWGIWKSAWEEDIRDTWDHDYSTGTPSGFQAGWDHNINLRVKGDRKFLYPASSRVYNVGRYGVHSTEQSFSVSRTPSYLHDRPKGEYRLI